MNSQIDDSRASLDERKFAEEKKHNEHEASLHELEAKLREREVVVKETESKQSRLLNPLSIGVLLAGIGLVGNIFVARLNDDSNHRIEDSKVRGDLAIQREKFQGDLLIQATKLGQDHAEICRNLVFFAKVGGVDESRQGNPNRL